VVRDQRGAAGLVGQSHPDEMVERPGRRSAGSMSSEWLTSRISLLRGEQSVA
jgi:hypothetical protein